MAGSEIEFCRLGTASSGRARRLWDNVVSSGTGTGTGTETDTDTDAG
jgi:hypothetical protein